MYGGWAGYELLLLVVIDPKEEKGAASLQSQLVEHLRSEGFIKQRLARAKTGEVEFYKWSPSLGEFSCQATLEPSEKGLSVFLSVQLDVREKGK